MPGIPYRLTEKCFREYEADITQAMLVLPSTYQIKPKPGRSQNTVEARLRDAMRSLHQFRWTTSVNMLKFDDLYNDIKVGRDGEDVVVFLRGSKQQQTQANVAARLDVPAEKCLAPNIIALAHLVQAGVLPCVCLLGAELTYVQDNTQSITDVAIVARDGNVYIM